MAAAASMPPEALIFDVDGMLAETEELHRAAFNAVFKKEGLRWHWDVPLYGELLKITGGKERLRHYCGMIGRPQAEITDDDIVRLHRRKNKSYAALSQAGACTLRPGVEALLRQARAKGLRLAICTTASRASAEVLLAAALPAAATEWFEVIVAGDEVSAKKPAPDAYLKVLSALALPASRCLAFEGSRNGLLSALAAGIETVVTPGLYTAVENFGGAAQVLPDLSGFVL